MNESTGALSPAPNPTPPRRQRSPLRRCLDAASWLLVEAARPLLASTWLTGLPRTQPAMDRGSFRPAMWNVDFGHAYSAVGFSRRRRGPSGGTARFMAGRDPSDAKHGWSMGCRVHAQYRAAQPV